MPEPLSKLESIIALTVVIEMIKIASLDWARSEEHTSELQSLVNLVCRLLLVKTKTT